MKIRVRFLFVLVLLFSCSTEETPVRYDLTIVIDPFESGSVSQVGGTFDSGTELSITATPLQGYVFKNWSGDASGNENPLSITLDSDKSVTANFDKEDTDGDGVTDALDQCPDTPAAETVDDEGCSDSQKDSDQDGVSDAIDECPETPSGEQVDETGCSDSQKDTDGDGVTDALDQCPDTPTGETVDDEGCSASQKDSDQDGVFDAIDECPETPSGEQVDETGCSDSQKDTDNDGVSDDLDQCPETPIDDEVDEDGCTLVSKTYVPDDAFEQFLIDSGYDDVMDDYVLTSNINSVEEIILDGNTPPYDDIAELTGLEDFTSLLELEMFRTSVTMLDLAKYKNLKKVSLHDIPLSSLTVEDSQLEFLSISQLGATMRISENVNLKIFSLEDINADSLVISNNSNLGGKNINLYFEDVFFESIQIDHNDNLESFVCIGCRIPSLNLSNNEKLIGLQFDFDTTSMKSLTFFNNSSFIDLDLVDYPDLESLVVSNSQFTSLDVSPIPALTVLDVTNNPLTCITVSQDQLDAIPAGWVKDVEDSYSLDCN